MASAETAGKHHRDFSGLNEALAFPTRASPSLANAAASERPRRPSG